MPITDSKPIHGAQLCEAVAGREQLFCRQAGLLVHDAEHFADVGVACGVAAPAGDALRDRIHPRDCTGGVGRDHRIGVELSVTRRSSC